MNAFAQNLRAFRVGTWLGWQLESNWTNPVVFFVFALFRPIVSAVILTVIYRVIAAVGGTDALFPYAFVGNAFYTVVGTLLTGMSWAVLEDRERMGMLKYVAMTPSSLGVYLMGRGVAKVLVGLISVPIVLLLGTLALDVPISPGRINWPLLVAALALGLLVIALLGLILAGITMQLANHGEFLGEAVAGGLYVFAGVIFPITILPGPVQALAYALPLTYWLEATRRALLGGGAGPGFEQFSDAQLLLILAGATLVLAVIAIPLERWAEHRAKEQGLLDMNSAY